LLIFVVGVSSRRKRGQRKASILFNLGSAFILLELPLPEKMPKAAVQSEIPADQHDGAAAQGRFMRMSKKRRFSPQVC
jgi:hypothetical protein